MPLAPDVESVVFGYRNANVVLRERVLSYLRNLWGGLGSYRDADIERFISALVPVVEAGQLVTATLTDAYLARLETLLVGERILPIGIPAATVSTEALRGLPAAEVYRRPGITVWTELSKGVALSEAIQRGLDRAEQIALTSMQLAKTHTSRRILGGKGNVTGYRRVLEGSKSCGLCVVASTRRYLKAHLMPIHGRCDCSVYPIYGNKDPGEVIDLNTLEGVHDAIAERFGGFDPGARGFDGIPDYRTVLIEHNHGELGPILSVRGQSFLGPSDL